MLPSSADVPKWRSAPRGRHAFSTSVMPREVGRLLSGARKVHPPLSHQGAGEFSRKLFRNGAASKTPEQVITFVVIVSVREVGHPNAALIVKGVHRI